MQTRALLYFVALGGISVEAESIIFAYLTAMKIKILNTTPIAALLLARACPEERMNQRPRSPL
jgi:multisubunit Na+/H+ antiporter MnhG subunit